MKYQTELDLSYNNTMTVFIDSISDNASVLEFGPASGRLTRYLKNNKNCSVYIVEIDEQAGMIAAESAVDYVIGDIMDYEWVDRFAGVKFDYILFADVLEHLRDAAGVLQRCLPMLKDTGRICLSVPNIAHNSVIIDLLDNHFRYTATGILDNTHVHFYTQESLEELVRSVGLNVEKRYATYTQVGKNEFDNDYCRLDKYICHMLKTRPLGEIYQYVYVLSKQAVAEPENHIREYPDYLYAQFFLDMHGGYEEVRRECIRARDTHYIFEVTDVQPAEKLRFDPYNEMCAVELVRAQAVSGGEARDLEFDSTNADHVQGNWYYFFKDDPQIHFLMDKGQTDKIVIEANYIFFSEAHCEMGERFSKEIKKLQEENEQRVQALESQENKLQIFRRFTSKWPIGALMRRYCKKNNITMP